MIQIILPLSVAATPMLIQCPRKNENVFFVFSLLFLPSSSFTMNSSLFVLLVVAVVAMMSAPVLAASGVTVTKWSVTGCPTTGNNTATTSANWPFNTCYPSPTQATTWVQIASCAAGSNGVVGSTYSTSTCTGAATGNWTTAVATCNSGNGVSIQFACYSAASTVAVSFVSLIALLFVARKAM